MMKWLSFLCLVLQFSCTNSIYHVASVQSEQVRLINRDFVYENDCLKVIYNLWEPGGRMRFLVFNKTDQPLYIDWSKSFLELNGTKTAYSQLPKGTTTDTVHYVYQNTFVEPYRVTAHNNQRTEIAPQMYVAMADIPIQQPVLHRKTKESLFTYTQANAPLQLKHQLAYLTDNNLTNPQIVAHSFWIDKIEVVRIGKLTRLYGPLKRGQPNALYAVEKRPAPGRW